jgi:hypothetical protein
MGKFGNGTGLGLGCDGLVRQRHGLRAWHHCNRHDGLVLSLRHRASQQGAFVFEIGGVAILTSQNVFGMSNVPVEINTRLWGLKAPQDLRPKNTRHSDRLAIGFRLVHFIIKTRLNNPPANPTPSTPLFQRHLTRHPTVVPAVQIQHRSFQRLRSHGNNPSQEPFSGGHELLSLSSALNPHPPPHPPLDSRGLDSRGMRIVIALPLY